ncbi:MAG: ATP-dependent Clp protease adaptor ClpS [Saprospirales bacterium]|nr:MAG: ATP-dependent Clp protease adaptor ClpS [Saprospirales bacterium]
MSRIYANISPAETEEAVLEEVVDSGEIAELIVYNDDHNTFDWVIKCFVEILHHSAEQAEQLSLIVHYKGKATVKTAPFSVLRPLRNALVDRGLSAVIESLQD